MHLYAALVPPPDVLRQVHEVVSGVAPVAEHMVTAGPTGKHRFGRRKDKGEEQAAPAPLPPMLDLVPPVAMHLPMAKFGALTLFDAKRLADTMDQEARTWETPRLSLAGGLVLEPEGDDGVWVALKGDVEALATLTRGVARVAQSLQLFVDRRKFRPHVRVGVINQHTTEAYLERMLGALDAYESHAWWMTTISLLVPQVATPGQSPYKTFRDIPLGPGVAH